MKIKLSLALIISSISSMYGMERMATGEKKVLIINQAFNHLIINTKEQIKKLGPIYSRIITDPKYAEQAKNRKSDLYKSLKSNNSFQRYQILDHRLRGFIGVKDDFNAAVEAGETSIDEIITAFQN